MKPLNDDRDGYEIEDDLIGPDGAVGDGSVADLMRLHDRLLRKVLDDENPGGKPPTFSNQEARGGDHDE